MPSKEEIIEVLKQVYDPEIQVDIWTLGLVYDIIPGNEEIKIKMTLTTPMCPYGPQLLANVKNKIEEMPGIKKFDLELVWDPPWKPSEELRAMLGV